MKNGASVTWSNLDGTSLAVTCRHIPCPCSKLGSQTVLVGLASLHQEHPQKRFRFLLLGCFSTWLSQSVLLICLLCTHISSCSGRSFPRFVFAMPLINPPSGLSPCISQALVSLGRSCPSFSIVDCRYRFSFLDALLRFIHRRQPSMALLPTPYGVFVCLLLPSLAN